MGLDWFQILRTRKRLISEISGYGNILISEIYGHGSQLISNIYRQLFVFTRTFDRNSGKSLYLLTWLKGIFYKSPFWLPIPKTIAPKNLLLTFEKRFWVYESSKKIHLCFLSFLTVFSHFGCFKSTQKALNCSLKILLVVVTMSERRNNLYKDFYSGNRLFDD